MRYYVRKHYYRKMFAVINGRGERISVHTTEERAQKAKKHYEQTNREGKKNG